MWQAALCAMILANLAIFIYGLRRWSAALLLVAVGLTVTWSVRQARQSHVERAASWTKPLPSCEPQVLYCDPSNDTGRATLRASCGTEQEPCLLCSRITNRFDGVWVCGSITVEQLSSEPLPESRP